jgi:hypothetical protein
MMKEDTLARALAESARHYAEKVPVYALERRDRERDEAAALRVGVRFCELHGIGRSRTSVHRAKDRALIDFAEGVRAVVHSPSGAFRIARGWQDHERPLARDAAKLDRDAILAQAVAHTEYLGLNRASGEEGLEFERLWQVKSSGRSSDGKLAPVTVERAIGAFRRHLAGLPVWGRASVYTAIAEDGALAEVGVDWRQVRSEPVDVATVVDPVEGARQVLAELDGFRPESELDRGRYSVDLFALGYFSMPKRRAQSFMQPVWVAMLRGEGRLAVNRLIVVPAAEKAYEPIHRLAADPPVKALRTRSA